MAEPDEEAEVLFALVRQRYGQRVTAAELEGVRQGVESIVATARALRALRLTNADEPFPPFVPFRGDS